MKLGINSYTYMWAIGFKGPNAAYPDREARPSGASDGPGVIGKGP